MSDDYFGGDDHSPLEPRFPHLDPKNARRLIRLRGNLIDLLVERGDLADEISGCAARLAVTNSLLRRTKLLIAYLEYKGRRKQ